MSAEPGGSGRRPGFGTDGQLTPEPGHAGRTPGGHGLGAEIRHGPSKERAPAVEMRGIVKSFPGVNALRGVDLSVLAGEVHVLLGENGAGKSTLMKILAGVYRPDAGSVLLNGSPQAFDRPQQALAAGIRTIYQELSLIEPLSVAENLFLARPPVGRLHHLSAARLIAQAREALAAIAPDVAADAVVASLPLGARQRVEITRALLERGRVLIMDEPTASLNAAETERLFETVRTLAARGIAILYITHRMEEIEAIGDRVTVLRDGLSAGTVSARDTPLSQLITMMVGEVPSAPEPVAATEGPLLLDVRSLGRAGHFSSVSLAVRGGEIVSVAGLVGSGMTDLARALFGAEPADTGEIRVDERPVRLTSPHAAIAAGIGYVPEDRAGQGLIPGASILHNGSLAALDRFATMGWLHRRSESEAVRATARQLHIMAPSLSRPVRLLSGGNQQKVVMAKWLASRARVLILNEPTRGVDVAARHEIYRLLEDLAAEGRAVLVFSSDLQEVVTISHRVLVMRRGHVVAQLSRAELSKNRVLGLAVGSEAAS